jgi:hypothetical protein
MNGAARPGQTTGTAQVALGGEGERTVPLDHERKVAGQDSHVGIATSPQPSNKTAAHVSETRRMFERNALIATRGEYYCAR